MMRAFFFLLALVVAVNCCDDAGGKPKVVSEGDSITFYWAGNYPAIYAANRPNVTVVGRAVSGARINDPNGGNGLVQRLAGTIAEEPTILTILIGANDLGDGNYETPDLWLSALFSYVASVKSFHPSTKVAVATILPICLPQYTDYNNRHKQRRPYVNTAIRAAVGTKIDAVIDFAADSIMGPDAGACNLTWYKDGLHPTDGNANYAGGQGRLARIYTTVLDQMLNPVETYPIIASNFNVNSELVPSWGTGDIPGTAAPDVVGAFRFICSAGHLAYDDPIVYPGQKGKSHLHQFFGNTLTDSNSNYRTLRTSGNSTCNSPLNRSGYWMPAMMDGKGGVVRPDYVGIYYKRRPVTDPYCFISAAKGCVDIPRGLRFIFGFDLAPGASNTKRSFYFNCDGPTAISNHYADIVEAAKNCPLGNRLGAIISAPSCWDGVNVDSQNHRSHMAYSAYNDRGQDVCPPTHPYLIPTFTLQAWYTTDGNLSTSGNWSASVNGGKTTWYLASDVPEDSSKPMSRPGSTFHTDWFGAWDDSVMKMWHDNCINKLLSCSGGDLGNGKQLKQFDGFSWSALPRVVPVPKQPL